MMCLKKEETFSILEARFFILVHIPSKQLKLYNTATNS